MLKKLILAVTMMSSLTALASPSIESIQRNCTKEEIVKIMAVTTGAGVVAGGLLGFGIAATMPVGAVGGPTAIVYFTGAGAANLGAWLVNGVAPMVALSGGVIGVGGALIGAAYVSKQCQNAFK